MPLAAKVLQKLEQALTRGDDPASRGPRLLDDARRLWGRLLRFAGMNLVAGDLDAEAMEVACYALQLPLRQVKAAAGGRPSRTNFRDRAEQAAEMLAALAGPEAADEGLLERAGRLLQDLPQRLPASEEAKLLADALNLDDFGVSGLLAQAVQLSRQGGGVTQVADGCEKREQYGYWDARLKEGFHFEPVRQIARRRLENTRRTAALLLEEVREDLPEIEKR